ncbi:ornithine cyclodeaminase family protein [Pseudoxanthobacter sp. M-2]|uniref:ornithine cyclodeaminase family protein n=1 Tax=Pseudoxanthobacter sp. M-2 TaxID=3078754 RepID=UPI0038FD2EAA
MRFFTAADLDRLIPPTVLVEALADAFRSGAVSPERHHHAVERPGAATATLLLMPAWRYGDSAEDGVIGVKVVTVVPDNASRGRPAVAGTYMLMSGATGEPIAQFDGLALTVRRTAAASALAASHLARADAYRMVMVGAGALAPFLIAAHASVRPIAEVAIWNRSPAAAEALVGRFHRPGLTVQAVTDLEAAVREADLVSCATLSTAPLVRGDWLKPGVHLDLVGGFRPDMREADDAAVARATVFVDTRAGALAEAGDLLQPIERGVFRHEDIAAELAELCGGGHPGRRHAEEVTLFKSVGAAIEDLAAAEAALAAA